MTEQEVLDTAAFLRVLNARGRLDEAGFLPAGHLGRVRGEEDVGRLTGPDLARKVVRRPQVEQVGDHLLDVERAGDGSYSAFVPDLPGCTTSGETIDEVKAQIKDAVDSYIDSLREHNEPIPAPTSTAAGLRAATAGGQHRCLRECGPPDQRQRDDDDARRRPIVVHGADAQPLPHILNVAFPGCQADLLLMNLDLAGDIPRRADRNAGRPPISVACFPRHGAA